MQSYEISLAGFHQQVPVDGEHQKMLTFPLNFSNEAFWGAHVSFTGAEFPVPQLSVCELYS